MVTMLEAIQSGVAYIVYVPEILEKLEALARAGHNSLEAIEGKMWTTVRHPRGLFQWRNEDGNFSLMLNGEPVFTDIASDEGYFANFSEVQLAEVDECEGATDSAELEPAAA